MTKAEMVRALAAHHHLKKADVRDLIDGFLDLIVASLIVGEDVKLELFGKFEPRDRKPVVRRNPQNGEPIDVPARLGVGFKPSLALKARLNGEP